MADPNDFQLKLKMLSDSYAVQLPQKLEQIELAWIELPIAAWDEEAFQSLHRMVHSLSGSGKTFGFAALSLAARNLEDALQPLAQAKVTPDEAQRTNIRALLDELHRTLAQSE